jgi:hypothetical protein
MAGFETAVDDDIVVVFDASKDVTIWIVTFLAQSTKNKQLSVRRREARRLLGRPARCTCIHAVETYSESGVRASRYNSSLYLNSVEGAARGDMMGGLLCIQCASDDVPLSYLSL